ncbi:MAG TPA: DUF1565 domain-containing protein, partial [Planctomycetota bacterium]|nr:DUF1565 domain-containing protein [Planctomycetota bacterium]
TDVRACTNAAQTQRSASTWYTLATGYIRIPVLADQTFILGVYMMDWDQNGSRNAKVSVCDLSQEASPPPASTVTTNAYWKPSKWLFWRVSAVSGDTISIRVEKVNNNNTVSALAFDPCEQAFAFLADPNTLRLFTESSATFTPSIDPAGATGAKADLTATDEFVLSTIMVDGSDVLASGGDDVLTFTDGAACDQGAVTVNSWAMAGTTQLSITESDTDGYTQQGIAKATISVTVVPRVVRLNGSSTIGLAPGESADRMIEIVDATLAAPGRIDATIGTVTGGSATIEASGDTFIADAARTSTGTIHITASPTVAGITSTTITLGNDFVFQETGSDTLDLKVLVLAGSTIYVSGTGSDTTGDGTELNPFRTIALACTPSTVSEIRVLPGIYSEDDGEVFPINVPAGVSIAGTMGPEQDETDTTVIDAGEAAYAFVLEPTTAPTTGALSSVKVVNFKTAADVTQWRGTIDNCVFTANAPAAVDGVLFYGAGGAVEITVSNTDVKDIRSTGARGIWRFGSGSGSVIVSRCLFSNITVGYNVDRRGIFNFEYPSGITFKAYDTIFEDLVTPGQDSEEGGMLLNVQGGLLIDRCVWRNITYTGPVINPNRTPGEAVIRNTLFQNVSTGTTNHGVVGCVYTTLKVTNCTFHNCSAAFDTGGSPSAPNQVWNCTVSNDTAGTNVISKGGIKANLHLHHVNIHNTEPGIGYDADNSDNVTTHDPAYRDASAGNFRLRKTSPLIDAGTNTPVTWPDPTDLDGKPRIMDGNADDDPVVDLGAYEYDPNVLVPTFTTAQPAYRIFAGATLHVPVSIAPSAGGAVTADVTFGTDLSGPATLDIPDGVGPASLAVTAASVLSVDDGTLTFVGLAEATSQGVDAGEFGVYLHNRTATVGGKSTLFVRSDSTVDVKVSLLNELCTAPGTISITTGTPGGSGTNTIGWMGDAIIPDGQRESTGALSITGGTGTNTITLGIDNGFTFQESSGAQLTIKVVGFASPLYVSGEGNDVTGDGSEACPLRTMTYALTMLEPDDEIRVLPGLYDAAAGESFPITLPATCSLVGTVGANEDDTDSAFVDAGGAANAFVLAQSAVGQTGLVQ